MMVQAGAGAKGPSPGLAWLRAGIAMREDAEWLLVVRECEKAGVGRT